MFFRSNEEEAKQNGRQNSQQNGDQSLSQNVSEESHRIPSDESLQNYTNILDISTNLFDSDRISNLDISLNKSEAEFNPCNLNDIRLTNDFEFSKVLLDGLGSADKGEIPTIKQVSSNQMISFVFCKKI